MPWSDLAQPKTIRALDNAARNPAHAYLLSGPDGSARDILAIQFVQALLCAEPPEATRPCGACSACRRVASGGHPDLIELRPQGKLGYREEETDEIPAQAAIAPFEGRHKVFLIHRADRMNRWGANALLKVLEEPAPHVVLILLAAEPEQMLETVRSRCRPIEVHAPPRAAVFAALRSEGLTEDAAERISRLAAGDLNWALAAARDPGLGEGRVADVATVLQLIESDLFGRFAWARGAADRFADDHDVLYAELDLLADTWRDILRQTGGQPDPTVTAGKESAVSHLAEALTAEEVTMALNAIISTKQALEANVNARLALESLMLILPRRDVALKGEDAGLAPRDARV